MAWPNAIWLYAISIVYAAVRYVVFAPKNLDNLPVFVVNKGLSMAAALCFSLAFWQHWRHIRHGRASDPASWFRAGMWGAVVHVPLSLALLSPGYFPEFYAGERLRFLGEAVFLFGGLTAGGLYLQSRSKWTPHQRWWLSFVVMGLLFGHTLCMGLARGLNLTASHAYLPPMWLLSLIGIALGCGFLLFSRPSSGTPQRAGDIGPNSGV